MLTLNLLPLTLLLMLHDALSFREYSKQDLTNLRDQVKDVFYHAYNGYLTHAFPYDELRPLSCDGIDTWGSYSLTLIDALDTLAIMGNYSEFSRVVDIITERANFDININVSVFETNIRIVGGLLSAHLFSERAGLKLEPGWPCNGPLLRLAEDVARRLLPAFDTVTGMPYGTVNLRSGVPIGETPVTCTAGVGTYIVEFGTLSRLTGDPLYEEVALNALRSLYKRRSNIGLFGNHIDTKTGIWTAQDSGIGAGVDSYFEYLVKGAILFQRPELLAMFNEVRGPIEKYLKRDDWYMWVSMHKGQITLPVFQSLEAFWPGVLSLVGDVNGAMKSLHNYHQVWKQYGFLPEFYNIVNSEASTNRESYPLRPELVESVMYLHRATGDPYLLDVGEDMLRSMQHSARTPCGYATVRSVVDHSQEDRMESFFLAETTKYLYLLFDTENFIHSDGSQGRLFETEAGKMCVLGAGGYVFNTEAHPIDLSALHCCSEDKLGDMSVEIRRRDRKVEREVGKKEIEENGEAEEGHEERGTQDMAEDDASRLDERTENGEEPVMKITRIPTVEGVRKPDATLSNTPRTEGTDDKPTSGEPSLLDKIQERFAQLENRIGENSYGESMKDKVSVRENSKYLSINDELSSRESSREPDRKDQVSDGENELNNASIGKYNESLNRKDQTYTREKPQNSQSNREDQMFEEENKPSKPNQKDQMTLEEHMTRISLDTLYNDSLRIMNQELTGLERMDTSEIHWALLGSAFKVRQNQKRRDAILMEEMLAMKRALLERDFLLFQDKLGSLHAEQEKSEAINDMYDAKLRQIQARLLELQGSSPDESWERVREIEKVIAAQAGSERDDLRDPVGPEAFKASSSGDLSDVKISVNSSLPSPTDENNDTLDEFHKQSPAELRVHTPDGNPPLKSYSVQENQLDDGYVLEENQSHLSDSIDENNNFRDDKNAFNKVLVSENHNVLSENHNVLSENHNVLSENHNVLSENHNVLSENHNVLSENHNVLSENHNVLSGKNHEKTENGFPAGESQDQCVGLQHESLRLCQLARSPPALVFNPQSLYAKIKSQDAAHSTVGVRGASYALLTCAPQPFFTRWSLRGEFFDPPVST